MVSTQLRLAAAAELELRRRRKALAEPPKPMTLREFTDRVTRNKYKWFRHSLRLCELLQKVADGEIDRLMVFMPPRAGKSYLVSKIFPAYYLHRHPEKFVGLASYAAALSYTFSRASREAYLEVEGKLRDDAGAISHWETIEGGGMWACGVGGAATGKGYSLGIVDDPEKNAEEAGSLTYQLKKREWWQSTWQTRAEPDGAIVLVQTRWNDADLAGWLLSCEDEDPERWHICAMAAIAESPPKYPATCTVLADWRSPGEALNPERFPIEKLLKIKARSGGYFWAAMYQQNPSPQEGSIVKRNWLKTYTTPPDDGEIVLSIDTAGSNKKTACPWVCTVWRIWRGLFYLVDVARGRWDYPTGKRIISELVVKWQPAATLIEDKSTGQSLLQELRADSHCRLYNLIGIQPHGDKVTRFKVQSAAFESGQVLLPLNADWVEDYLNEILRFPMAATADQVDSTSQFLAWARKRSLILPRHGTG